MRRTFYLMLIAALLVPGLFVSIICAQEEGCNSAFDFVVQARERARPGISREETEQVRLLLKTATELCQGLGDAWYYRHLYSKRLGDQKDAGYALAQAQKFNSEGLHRNDDPFAPVAMEEVKVPPVVREKWALVVGIGKYQDPGIRPLKYTVKDARDFAALLSDPKYGRFKPQNVRLLIDKEATTERIKSEIESLGGLAAPDDLVVIYIATHGSPRELSKTDVNYIVTWDTSPTRLFSTSLPMVDLFRDISKLIPAQRVVAFLDTCFSGAATLAGAFSTDDDSRQLVQGSSESSPKLLDRFRQSTSRVIIAASQENQSSYESNQLQNGIFTHYLIQALRQQNGMIPIGDAYSYLREQVIQRVRTERQASQIPIMSPTQVKADIRIGIAPQKK